jgi:hypothetical protein
MTLLRRFRDWRDRRRLKRAAKKPETALREFVYLDEVSVVSLLASRVGPIAAEFTETQSKSLQIDVGGSLGGGVGIAEAKVNPRLLDTRTYGSQVVRRSIVQSKFKQLYEHEVASLAMRPMFDDQWPPGGIHIPDAAIAENKASAHQGWIVDPDNLTRGQLLEVEIELEAEPIFRMSAVISAVLEMLEENPGIIGYDSYGELMQARSVGRILEKLLIGLVPVRGRATDYEVLVCGGKEWVVHRRLLNGMPATVLARTRPLYIVGVAEQVLFWKDIRRILFSKARFRTLCRIAQDGLQPSWTPVKLAHVLESVAPGLASEIDILRLGAMATRGNTSSHGASLRRQLMRDALISHALVLADHYGQSLAEQDFSEVSQLSEQLCGAYGSTTERRAAFDEIAAFVLGRLGLEREPLVVAECRRAAMCDAGLDITGQPMSLVASEHLSAAASPEERFLDTEFVAIYW